MAKARKEASHSVTFAKGGKGHMFGQQAADKMKPGTTRDKTATDDLSQKWAQGGKGKMFGFQPANAQTAGRTSSY
jgi:hypothetical protein